jgi:oxygen-independent coproporphyrinogen-3 oxidase
MNARIRHAFDDPIALYVHIPFCETKCPYCDFNTYAGIEPLIPEYAAALRRETGIWGRLLGGPRVATVFFGGGTPSYLPAEQTGSIVQTIRDSFEVSPEAEVTLEANPGDLTADRLDAFLETGINRLSIGVQSLDDRLLDLLGRRHSAAEAVLSFQMAARAGFDNVSIDLMYGLPQQGLDQWSQTLGDAAGLEPDHVSMYCLTLEPGTPMERQVGSGLLPDPDPDLAADMYLAAEDLMRRRGYRHYEISNWAQPGKESRHNLAYWKNQRYLGVGPGAHSYLGEYRFHNLRSPRDYIRRLEDGLRDTPPHGELTREAIEGIPVVDKTELIGTRMEMAETMMMGLRLNAGIGFRSFARRFGVTPMDAYRNTLDDLEATGLLETTDSHVRLTSRGRLLGNEVFSRFFDGAGAPA